MSLLVVLLAGSSQATDLQNIESIASSGGSINISDDLDMNGNRVMNYFDSSCPTGETLVDIHRNGSFDCLSVVSAVQDDLVSRSGDSMTGNLDIRQNYLTITNSDGDYYLGGGNAPDSASSGVHLETNTNPSSGNPIFVVESSGGSERLRVEHNGVTSTSNSFDAANGYTEAGSNTLSNDISGDADTLDGNHGSYYLDNTDNQDIQASATGDTIDISIDNGNGASATITDNYDPNTDATTECSGSQYLGGDGTCRYDSYDADTDNQGIDDVLSQDSTATNQLDMSSGTIVVPTGDVY